MNLARRGSYTGMTPSTYVLVPGAGGDAYYWHRVVPVLRDAGHEAIAVDLPAGDDRAGLAEYADLIAGAIGDRSDVVLVAQSMGAYSAPLACAKADVARMVLVAPMIPAPGETASEFWAATGQGPAARALAEREGRDPDAPFDLEEGFLHDVPPDVVARVMARGAPGDSATPFEQPWPLDAWPEVPISVIAGARDRLFPLDYMRRLARERLGIEKVAVIDAGHLPALSRPEELAGLLLARD
jgi:pimeloyl-ACP methyl ester carboxylesterase